VNVVLYRSPKLALLLLALTGVARGQDDCVGPDVVLHRLDITGNSKTTRHTIESLLPRRLPATYSGAELADFARRVNNLGVFDSVAVDCQARVLHVSVREKWTIVPEIDFSSGKTFEDSYFLLGATEYNLFGTANELGLSAYREQRGFGVAASFGEHDYQRSTWAHGADLTFGTVALRFDDGSGWRTTSATLDLAWRSPPWLHPYFNYVAGFYGSYEAVHSAEGASAPASTGALQTYMEFSWDAYEWHDLVPRGLQSSLWVGIGGVFGGERPLSRHTAGMSLELALPLGGASVVVSRAELVVGTRGNVNYSNLLGSIAGVRGLRDAQYFNWVQALSNLEVRHSVLLSARWALQGVMFTDAALFEQMTPAGGRGAAGAALAVGLGVRVVPTWLSSIVLRLDASRLLAPAPANFAQVGLNQYF
jgi:hypothetical protein